MLPAALFIMARKETLGTLWGQIQAGDQISGLHVSSEGMKHAGALLRMPLT